jgi:putative Holliday junction resolvase
MDRVGEMEFSDSIYERKREGLANSSGSTQQNAASPRVVISCAAFLEQSAFYGKAGGVLNHEPRIESFSEISPHPALGVDYGGSRIGIAVTDDFGIMPHPVETIDLTKGSDGLARISEIAALRKVRTLVMGLPLRLDGTEGDSAKKVRNYAEKLSRMLPHLTLVFVDETYSTLDASQKLHEAGKNARKQKAVIDQAAAVEILNRWMEENA